MNARRQIKELSFALVVLVLSMTASSCFGALAILDSAFNPANRHTYYVLETSNWTDAEAQAVLLGGHLATINDQAENDWIISRWGEASLWIGLSDAASEGTFVWANGEPVTYTRWRGGEPNNGGTVGGNEDFTYIYAAGFSESPGQWNDFQNVSVIAGQPEPYGVVEVPCLCPANIVTNTAQGQCGAMVTFLLNSCLGTNRCEPPSGSQFAVGTTPVVCTAVDTAGNTNRCSFNVTVDVSPAGPVVLAGIDAEDGGPGGHGPIATWQTLVNNVYNQARGGSGILVLGGGKRTNDFITLFWNAISTGILQTVTFVNSNRMATQSFAGFRMLAVASDFRNVILGGLTQGENDILRDRAGDMALFVNGGGGLLGFSSQFPNLPAAAGPYDYMAGLGGVSLVSLDYTNIDATAEGLAVGLNDSLDVNRWHQYFSAHPDFLKPLAYVHGTTNAAAIGGSQVNILVTCPNPVTVPCTASVTLTTQVYNTQCRLLTAIWRIDGAAVRTNTVLANLPNAALTMSSVYSPGIHTVSVTVNDGQSSQSCITTVTVDGTPPAILCPAPGGVISTNTEPRQCSAVVTFNVTATDECSGVASLTCSPTSGSRFPRGTTNIICTARDTLGNTASCSFQVSVVDRERPVITCPPNIVTNTGTAQCARRVFFSVAATDNCPSGAGVNCSPPSGFFFPVGTTTVNCTATDTSQNATNCAFTITVTDNQGPVLDCPGDITANALPGECAAVVNFTADVSDNCPGTTVTCNPPSGSTFSNRTTLVSCTSIDSANNRADCSFTVTLNGSMMTTPLMDVAVCSGEAATFTTTAAGDGPLTYAWTLDGNTTGTNGPTLTVATDALALGNHTVAVMVRAWCGLASNSAILTVGSPVTAGNLTNLTRCVCESVNFNPIVSGGEAARFVWRANGHVLEGETNSTLRLQSLKESDAGLYTVEVHGLCNKVTNSATLTLEGSSSNPLLLTNPAPIAINDHPATASPYPSVIRVKCVPGILTSLAVTLNGITHSYPDDVDVLLVNPAGQAIKLMSDAGGGAPIVDLRLGFEDGASRVLFNESQLTNGVFRPSDYNEDGLDVFPGPAPGGTYATNLAQLTGLVPNGNWMLYVLDDALADGGGIARGWSMQLSWEAAPARFSGMGFLSNGHFQMRLSGVAGRTHMVEASSDLEVWTPIATNNVSTDTFIVVDPQSSNFPQRFYRAILCP